MVPVCVYPAGRAIKQKTDAVKTASVFLYAGKASPAGEAVSGPARRLMRGRCATATRERAIAANSPLIRPCGATFPQGGRLFWVNL